MNAEFYFYSSFFPSHSLSDGQILPSRLRSGQKLQIWIRKPASYLKYSHINDVFHCNSVKYYPSLLSIFALWIEISSLRNDIWFLPLLLRSTFFPPPTLQTSIMYQYIILERKQQFCWVNNLFFKTRIQEQEPEHSFCLF